MIAIATKRGQLKLKRSLRSVTELAIFIEP